MSENMITIQPTSTEIYNKIYSKIAKNYHNEKCQATLLQNINQIIIGIQNKLAFLEKTLLLFKETETSLRNMYDKNSKNAQNYRQFDDTMDYDVECEYYDTLDESCNTIDENLRIRIENIEKEIKISKEKLKEEVDNKEIVEFLGGVSPPRDDLD